MTMTRLRAWIPVGGVFLAALGLTLAAADPPGEEVRRPPSTFAPAEDLESQVQFFLDRAKEDLASESKYGRSSVQRVVRDAHTLAVLALVLGKHDQTNRYQSSALEMLHNALQLAEKAPRYDEAKRAFAQLQAPPNAAALPDADLQWRCVGDIVVLMHQIPKLNDALRRQVKNGKPEQFERSRGVAAGLAATLAAIAHVSMFDASYCSDQADQAKWAELCVLMRDAAYEVNQAARRGDQQAAVDRLKPLQRTCDECHAHYKD